MSRQEKKAEERKKKKKGGILYTLVMIVLLGVMGFAGFNLWKIYHNYSEGTEAYIDFANIAGAGDVIDVEQDNSYLTIDWESLWEVNKDIVGWIRLPDTVINYPIVKGSDNDYYLTHLIDGSYSIKGTIFVDAKNPDPLEGFLTIMYGHRMKDWSMFGLLGDYFSTHGPDDFFEKNPVWQLYTPEGTYDLHIFAAGVVDSADEDVYKFSFETQSERQAYINRILAFNELQGYDNRVKVGVDDEIIMMSTCTLRGSDVDDDRVVVWAKKEKVEKPNGLNVVEGEGSKGGK